ncbi:MAG: hypothetical protein MHM6MM_002517 [Cercozoa sp. M6MM]
MEDVKRERAMWLQRRQTKFVQPEERPFAEVAQIAADMKRKSLIMLSSAARVSLVAARRKQRTRVERQKRILSLAQKHGVDILQQADPLLKEEAESMRKSAWKKWLLLSIFAKRLSEPVIARQTRARINAARLRAALTVQRMWKRYAKDVLPRRRMLRAAMRPHFLRLVVQLRVRKKQRAARVVAVSLIQMMQRKKQTSMVQVVIKRFRTIVSTCQRAVRCLLAKRAAQLALLLMHLDLTRRQMFETRQQSTPSQSDQTKKFVKAARMVAHVTALSTQLGESKAARTFEFKPIPPHQLVPHNISHSLVNNTRRHLYSIYPEYRPSLHTDDAAKISVLLEDLRERIYAYRKSVIEYNRTKHLAVEKWSQSPEYKFAKAQAILRGEFGDYATVRHPPQSKEGEGVIGEQSWEQLLMRAEEAALFNDQYELDQLNKSYDEQHKLLPFRLLPNSEYMLNTLMPRIQKVQFDLDQRKRAAAKHGTI